MTWKEVLGEEVRMMTFDRRLWAAAEAENLTPIPDGLRDLLASWAAS